MRKAFLTGKSVHSYSFMFTRGSLWREIFDTRRLCSQLCADSACVGSMLPLSVWVCTCICLSKIDNEFE